MHNNEILERLKSYPFKMYRNLADPGEIGLRTGDVVKLTVDDFGVILKNFPLLKPILESYYSNSKYSAHLWAILNKPCDMVHEGTQKFKSSSLFIAPLQSFKGELKKDRIFSEYVIIPTNALPTIEDKLFDLFNKVIVKKAAEQYPINGSTPPLEKKELAEKKNNFLKNYRDWFKDQVLVFLEGYETPSDVQEFLFAYSSSTEDLGIAFKEFGLGLNKNDDWVNYVAAYNAQIKSFDEIRLNPEKLKDLASNVFLNQMEIRGRFYYEPHYNLFSEEVNDFSYVIELEDLLTVKISEDSVKSGVLVSLLKDKRVVGLTRNFSDRLQNIMGYYYSKIGTPDVTGKQVWKLYDECFDNFFVDQIDS